MATSEGTNVDILVHITAPSRGQDDAKYRALARAYLDFEPLQRLDLGIEEDAEVTDNETDLADGQLQDELLHSTQEERESEASYQPPVEEPESVAISTQSKDIDHLLLEDVLSSQLSFNDVEHNLGSPAVRWPAKRTRSGQGSHIQSQHPEDSWVAPPSTIEDSQPTPEKPAGSYLSPTSALESILLRMQSSANSPSPAQKSAKPADQSTQFPSPRRSNFGKRSLAGSSEDSLMAKKISLIPGTYSPEQVQASSAADPLSPSPRRRAKSHSPEILRTRSSNILSQECTDSPKRKERTADDDENHISCSAPSSLAGSSDFVNDSLLSERAPKRMRLEPAGPNWMPTEQLELQHHDEPSSDLIPTAPFEATQKQQCAEYTSSDLVPTAPFTPSLNSSRVLTSRRGNQPLMFTDKLEIHPPEPLISNSILTPERFITSAFKKLEQHAHAYIPTSQKRELRPMERGYWLFEWKDFDTNQRAIWWNNIGDFVSRGLGGWSIWCVRDEQLGTVRVYCWGTLVMHVYLMLFVSTEYKIRGKGARWIGGDGQDIVIMPT